MNYNLFKDVSPMMRGDEYEEEWEKLRDEINNEAEHEDDDDYVDFLFGRNNNDNNSSYDHFKPMESIKEEEVEVENSSTFSFDFTGRLNGDVVCVAVRRQKLEASMDALKWALMDIRNSNNPFHGTTCVLLIHVFPGTKYIPTPMGNFPVGQVNPEQKENYMAHQRNKRRQLLQEYLDICSKSQVKVDRVEIESDNEAKAILDLIPILNIRKLVLGVTKSTARRLMMRSKRGNNGVSEQIVQNAAEFCDVKVICEGKEISELTSMDFPSCASPTGALSDQEDNIHFKCFGSN